MPHFSFTISQGGRPRPSIVSDHPDDDTAKREAAGMFADVARDISKDLQAMPEWQIEVSDSTGRPIFKIKVIAESE